MSPALDPLILDLLEWIGPDRRPYLEVMDAWRTSCPQLPVWEEANLRGFIVYHDMPGLGTFVSVSPTGTGYLRSCRPPPGTARS